MSLYVLCLVPLIWGPCKCNIYETGRKKGREKGDKEGENKESRGGRVEERNIGHGSRIR